MPIGYVIGNGESRKDFDLRKLNNFGPTYGCHALHRDYSVQNLVCTSNSMLNEAVQYDVDKKSYIHTTHKLLTISKNPNLKLLPEIPYKITHKNDQPENWNSGSYAILLGALENDIVTIIGFDFTGIGERSFTRPFGNTNNIYKNTTNYPKESDKQRDMAPDVQQIGHLVEHFKNVKFIFINDWIPDTLVSHSNSFQDSFENLEKQLLTK